MNMPVAAYYHEGAIPAKINAAMDFIRHVETVRTGAMSMNPFGGPSQDSGRELSKHEGEVYDSALTVLLEYFNEPGFGGAQIPPSVDGEDPEERATVEARP